MIFRDSKSIIIILGYLALNTAIIAVSFNLEREAVVTAETPRTIAPEYTLIEELEYFHLKNGLPLLSLAAVQMRSQGEEIAEFESPIGLYNYQKKNQTLKYQAKEAVYRKPRNLLTLIGDVKVTSDEAQYYADRIKYFFDKDLVIGTGNIRFEGDDLKTRDHVKITASKMRAHPQKQTSRFEGGVAGEILRRRQYEGKTTFSSEAMDLQRDKSLAQLQGNVVLKRSDYLITAGKADIHLENFNNSLKYFVLNDDVKLREKLRTPEGQLMERRAFAERLEGFGRDQKMVLSGAPRVEQGEDVIKGYRITIRENAELIEVDDAMSDVQVKKKKLKE